MKITGLVRGTRGLFALLLILLIGQTIPCRAVPFAVGFWYPTNGETYPTPASVGLHAWVTDSNVVQTMQYYSGAKLIRSIANTNNILLTNTAQENPFFLDWSNVPAATYILTAVALDSTGATATSAPVNITVSNAPPPVVRPETYIYSPANNSAFLAPAKLTLYARAAESGGAVASVQFFENNLSLGVVPASSQMVFSNISSEPLFPLAWTNVMAGSYTLHVLATDTNGNTATSSVVNISVVTNFPPVTAPFAISFWYPTNGQTFAAPANIGVHARVTDSNLVEFVQYYSGSSLIGIVSNTSSVLLTNAAQENPFYMAWSNVLAGAYTLTAVATDSSGNMATSAPVNIIVTNAPPPVIPFAVGFFYPTNGQWFAAPANVGVHARVTDSNVVESVQYLANAESIGVANNTKGLLLTNSTEYNPFFLDWSDVPAGNYTLLAVATDSAGNMATSGPVNILVLTNLPPVVRIYATDPVAAEGTNGNWFTPGTSVTNYISGTNTATFLVRRDSETNAALTVYYSIGGTASNGVDYVAIPNSVTLPTGQRYSLITIVPLEDDDYTNRPSDTVVLSLTTPTNDPPAYTAGSPASAGAVILEQNFLPIMRPMIHTMADNSIHVSLPGTNGLNYCLEVSSDLVNWTPVCTNTVLKGSAQYVDPSASAGSNLYYRIISVGTPASY